MQNFRIDTKKLTIKELAELRRLEYNRIGYILCPLLDDEPVYFNSRGFFHLTHNGRGKRRGEADQRMRLNLLPSAVSVVRKSRTFGAPVREEVDKSGRRVIYYELKYRFSESKAVAVILRKVGGGKLHYYSVRYAKN